MINIPKAMHMTLHKIAVLGRGKIGTLASEMLFDAGFEVCSFDNTNAPHDLAFPAKSLDVSKTDDLKSALKPFDAVLSCLPYHLNQAVATTAHALAMAYFDLTEDVSTTQAIRTLSETSHQVMAPQCGLAPGFIGIVGAHLAAQFDNIRSIRLRVGALPQNPTGLLGYAFNWSPEGVVNEYLNDCEVIEDGDHKWVSPMEWRETLYVNGTKLEAFTTSGGLGTMCETYGGRVDNLDYKTMRYPGHVDLMNFFFHELLMRDNRAEAGRILTNAKPPVDEDMVYIHASVEGTASGRLQRKEYVRAYPPRPIAGKPRTAIAWTTSASVCAVIEMARNGDLAPAGFIKQEEIALSQFLKTKGGSHFNRDSGK